MERKDADSTPDPSLTAARYRLARGSGAGVPAWMRPQTAGAHDPSAHDLGAQDPGAQDPSAHPPEERRPPTADELGAGSREAIPFLGSGLAVRLGRV